MRNIPLTFFENIYPNPSSTAWYLVYREYKGGGTEVTVYQMSRYRQWCGTLNNPEDDLSVQKTLEQYKNVRYACGQIEVGEQGTRHCQYYLECSKPVRFSTLQRMLPRSHLENRSKGTREQARAYCRWPPPEGKTGDVIEGSQWELGTWTESHQGERSDLKEAQEYLRGGGSVRSAILEFPAIAAKYPRFLPTYKNALIEPRNSAIDPEVEVYVGPSGCGKTRKAHEDNPDLWKLPIQQPHTLWLDTYEGQSVALIDDYEGEIPFRVLLRLLDRYPEKGPVKGSFVEWAPKKIIITSNLQPENWYTCQDITPLKRRITKTINWNI